jgi:riboflavin kinase/FMN adenylyltransferase
MRIVRFSSRDVPTIEAKTALCLGTFDGVHKGHQALLNRALDVTPDEVGVFLFDANPSDLLQNGKSHSILTTLDDKLNLLSSLKVDSAYVVHIDKEFFDLKPDEFVTRVLLKLHPSSLVVGVDYSFGAQAAGTKADLQKDFEVFSVPLLKEGNSKISTQGIIKELSLGHIEKANLELGRPYEIKGLVGHGLGNGHKLGFPTANLVMEDPYALPKDGVYVGMAYSRGLPYKALINVGENPTIGVLKAPKVESYLEGLAHDIYGETLYVSFLRFLRAEIKFPSFEELKGQIEKDKAALR